MVDNVLETKGKDSRTYKVQNASQDQKKADVKLRLTKDGEDADTSKGKSGGQDPGGVRLRVDRRVLLLCPLS